MKWRPFYHIFFLVLAITASLTSLSQPSKSEQAVPYDRDVWLNQLNKLARPVLSSLAHDSLKLAMPKNVSIRSDNPAGRVSVMYLEVLGRVLSGIAPWLQLNGGSAEEVALRAQYRTWAIKGLTHALDSNAKDFMRFDISSQQLVDASFLAFAFIRAPWLWDNLGKKESKAY